MRSIVSFGELTHYIRVFIAIEDIYIVGEERGPSAVQTVWARVAGVVVIVLPRQ